MFKEYLLYVVEKNPILTEDKPFLYPRIIEKIENMTEQECKKFIFKEGKEDKLYKLIAATSLGMTATQLALGRKKMDECKRLARKIKNKEEQKRALAACHSGGI